MSYKAAAERTDEAERLLTPPFRRSTTKVTIVVNGGNVQGVFSNDPAIEVTLVDHDNLREEHDRTERENIELDAIRGLREILIK
jgi:hypothetical protein